MGSQNYSLPPHENSVAIDVNVAKTRMTAMFQLEGIVVVDDIVFTVEDAS